jgi:uncharacterized protein
MKLFKSKIGKIKILILLALINYNTANSQNIFFKKSNYLDSLKFEKNIKLLANQLLYNYSNSNENDSLDNLFRIQICATQFDTALVNLKKYRDILRVGNKSDANGIGFVYELYAKTILLSGTKMQYFEKNCTSNFVSLYKKLSNAEASTASSYFDNKLEVIEDNLTKFVRTIDRKDSLAILEAKKLCRLYLIYQVYKKVLPICKPILEKIEKAKYLIQDSILIKTRDGATISAVVVRNPTKSNKLPTVLMFNIYKGAVDINLAKVAVDRGYVGIVANTRGKGLSPQEIEPYEHDEDDGYDIIEWISKQPWSNGKVGMYGGSYLGFSQWATVKNVHPALKTIVPQVAVGFGIDFPSTNNVFYNYGLQWLHYVMDNKTTNYASFSNQKYWDSVNRKWYTSGVAFRFLDSIEGNPNKIFQRWLQHPNFDSFWQNTTPNKHQFAKINIPVLTITGYFDDDQLGALYYFNEHHKYNKNANHHLLIGPYDHGGAQALPSNEVDGYKIDSVAKINITDLVFNWFNYILKGAKKPVILKDKVNYEVMGKNIWKHALSLAKMNNDTLTFYLGTEKDSLDFKMTTLNNTEIKYTEQEIDFKDRGDTVFNPNQKLNSLDKKNIYTYITPVFKDSFEINGVIVGEILASINKKDFDILLDIQEVDADGKTFFISSNYFRASYAKDKTTRNLLKPEQVETIPIVNNYMTSLKIKAGSRLVFGIGVVKKASAQINYGTGKDVSDETILDAGEPLKVKWYNGTYFKVPIFRDK